MLFELRLHDTNRVCLTCAAQSVPRQAHGECAPLLCVQVDDGRVPAWPHQAALVQPSGAQPQAKAVVHQHFHAAGARVGKGVGDVGLGAAKDGDHAVARMLSMPQRMSRGSTASCQASTRIRV